QIKTTRVKMNRLKTYCANLYRVTISTTNESGFIFGRFSPAGGGSKSAAGKKILCVFKSSAIVRALFFVGTFSSTVNLSGESSCTTVNVPSCIFDENAKQV